MAELNKEFIVNLQGKSFVTKSNNHIHGLTGTRIYRAWQKMKERCDNPNVKEYKNYGERGISYCDDWSEFVPFYEWAMESGYDEELTLDRIDNNGNYEPDNCRWATHKEQSLNRRTNVILDYRGESKPATVWAEEIGMKPRTLLARIRRGWSTEDAIERSVR